MLVLVVVLVDVGVGVTDMISTSSRSTTAEPACFWSISKGADQKPLAAEKAIKTERIKVTRPKVRFMLDDNFGWKRASLNIFKKYPNSQKSNIKFARYLLEKIVFS